MENAVREVTIYCTYEARDDNKIACNNTKESC